MLSRRIIRVKTMQTLFSDAIGKDISPVKLEKVLLESIARTKQMYFVYLLYLVEVCNYSIVYSSRQTKKLLDENANKKISTKLATNSIIALINDSKIFHDYVNENKLNNFVNKRLVKDIFDILIEKEKYQKYIDKKFTTDQDNIDILRYIIKKVIGASLELYEEVEDNFINIEDDQYYVLISLQKKLKSYDNNKEILFLQNFLLQEDKKDIVTFGSNLLYKYYDHNDELVNIIEPKLKNWEIDRVATIDVVLLKMAICELKYFPNIPVKVTINEYIDIAKEYSSEKSKSFINGMLDKIMLDLKSKNELKKQGRGLIN